MSYCQLFDSSRAAMWLWSLTHPATPIVVDRAHCIRPYACQYLLQPHLRLVCSNSVGWYTFIFARDSLIHWIALRVHPSLVNGHDPGLYIDYLLSSSAHVSTVGLRFPSFSEFSALLPLCRNAAAVILHPWSDHWYPCRLTAQPFVLVANARGVRHHILLSRSAVAVNTLVL
jgi:hypothetical protein